MTDALIEGVGMTRFEGESARSVVGLAALAAERALADSPHARSDVGSLHVGNALAEALGTRAGIANALAAALGIEGVAADRVENTSATGASACHRGVDAVERGAGVALVVGVEKMSVAETSTVTGIWATATSLDVLLVALDRHQLSPPSAKWISRSSMALSSIR